MEGLEVTDLKLSKLVVDNDPFRLDSEFHRKECIAAIKAVRAFGAEQFKESSPTIIHPHEIVREYVEADGVWFLRAQNVRPLAIDEADKVFVSRRDAETLAQNRLELGDVLITRTGANRGDCAYFDSKDEAVASSHTFIVRSTRWEHAFLVAFLNSCYGRLQIEKGVYGAAQPEVAPYYLRHVWIPKASQHFQKTIARVFDTAGKERNKALQLADEAEKTLLAALGLGDWQPPEPLTYTRRASEAFAAHRLDAEFYHPAKRAYLDRLAAMPGRPLAAHYAPVRDMFDPKDAAPGELVRNFDLTDALQPVLDDTCQPMTAREVGSTKKRLQTGDVVTSRLRAYLRETALVRISPDIPAVGSSEFIVLRPREQHPRLGRAALIAFLRSRAVQTILQWSQEGNQHPRYSEDTLLGIPVPNVVCDISADLEALFDSMLAARARARALLERAKRAVEIAIEQNEAAALRFLG